MCDFFNIGFSINNIIEKMKYCLNDNISPMKGDLYKQQILQYIYVYYMCIYVYIYVYIYLFIYIYIYSYMIEDDIEMMVN